MKSPKQVAAPRAWDTRPGAQLQTAPSRAVSVATIAGASAVVPPYLIPRETVKRRIKDVFSLDDRRLEAIHAVIDNSGIDERHSVFPVDYTIEPRPLAQINKEYREH